MKLSNFLTAFILILGFIGCKSQNPGTNERKPNVIVILSDDQGWGDLSVSGNLNLSTPNIDKLAEGGAIFDRFYVSPVCSPTRAEFLTGRYSPRGGVYSTSAGGERLDLDETTIAEVFKKAGYVTSAYGKWHNGMQYPYHPNGRGFDEFYGFCSGHWGNYFSPMLEHNGKLVQGDGFVIDDFTNEAMEFIEENKGTPFFIYLPYNTPHSPMQVPDEYWNRFKDNELTSLFREPEKEKIQFTKAALAMCENIDWNVGRIVRKVQELNLEENTIILYFSDNGPNGNRWNDGMKGRKGSTDEGGVRSPLIMQWSGTIKEGKNIKEISAAIDLLPTLAELTGIPYETNNPIDGVSLAPLLTEENPVWNDRFVFNHWRGRTSVRSQQFRLGWEDKLFDMHKDPGQYTDISNENKKVYEKLKKAKEEFISEVVSELPEKDFRTFPLGHPDFENTQIPARDGKASGNIRRSNRYPNCSYFSNWISTEDLISWDVDVVEAGDFEIILYYTCPEKDLGSKYEVKLGDSKIIDEITEAHNPPEFGMDEDRDPRIESYVKEFKAKRIGTIKLEKGEARLTLKALEIPGSQVMDFRLMMFRRIKS